MVCLKNAGKKLKKLANWNKCTNKLLNIAMVVAIYYIKKHLSTYTHAFSYHSSLHSPGVFMKFFG